MSNVGDLVARLLRLERPLLIALDVDGTISPIARDPDMAEIPAETLATLAALLEETPVPEGIRVVLESEVLPRLLPDHRKLLIQIATESLLDGEVDRLIRG